MEKKIKHYVSYNQTIKWTYEGKRYCLHIRTDEQADDPRDWACTKMVCFHRNYNLGDHVSADGPWDFWEGLLNEYLSKEELEAADDLDAIMDSQTIMGCQRLLHPYIEWLPLWLYDHSGISMSCGDRTYPYNDRWDSMPVGWIYISKTGVIDLGFEKSEWREKARDIMRREVEEYNEYLTGEVYGYDLYERMNEDYCEDEQNWECRDSSYGYLGSDIYENGMIADVGSDFEKAMESGNYEVGTAKKHTKTWYTF